MEDVPGFYDDLDATLRYAWAQLERGAADRRSPLNTPVLATRATDGAPRARTVILRAADAARRELSVYTDARSAKVGAIHSDPRVALHAYHHRIGFQLRITGVARIHVGDDVARAAWSRLRPAGRLAYLGAAPPGSQAPGPAAGSRPSKTSRRGFGASPCCGCAPTRWTGSSCIAPATGGRCSAGPAASFRPSGLIPDAAPARRAVFPFSFRSAGRMHRGIRRERAPDAPGPFSFCSAAGAQTGLQHHSPDPTQRKGDRP